MLSDRSKSILTLMLLAFLIAGCLAEDPSSFRSVDTLLSGLWFQDAPSSEVLPTIDLRPDQSFEAYSSAVPGITVAGYTGKYWQANGVIAFRGTSSVPGIHVQFVTFRITDSPVLVLTLTGISDAYVAKTVGVEDLSSLSADDVQSAMRRLDGLPAVSYTHLTLPTNREV